MLTNDNGGGATIGKVTTSLVAVLAELDGGCGCGCVMLCFPSVVSLLALIDTEQYTIWIFFRNCFCRRRHESISGWDIAVGWRLKKLDVGSSWLAHSNLFWFDTGAGSPVFGDRQQATFNCGRDSFSKFAEMGKPRRPRIVAVPCPTFKLKKNKLHQCVHFFLLVNSQHHH